jgi:hypothetical protein
VAIVVAVKWTTTTEEDTMDIREPTLWDRIGVAAVSLLLAAFVMSVAAPAIANATTSDNAKRDDDFRAVTAVEDDEDDDRDLLRGDSKGTRDKTGKSTRKDKSDKTGKNTGNGKDTRTGKSGDNTRTGKKSGKKSGRSAQSGNSRG